MDRNMYEERRKRLKQKRRRSCLGVFLTLLTVVLVPLIVMTVYFKFYKPDGNDKILKETATDEYGNVIEITHKLEAVEDEYNVLVLGHDKDAKLTDVVMLVNVNNNDRRLTVMQIPRDTYFGGKSAPTASVDKVNEVFVTYYNGYRKNGESVEISYKLALGDTKKLFSDAISVNIDFAAIMDLAGFRNIVDAIGGVEINVPTPLVYYDEDQDLAINIPSGLQTLDGETAEGFVRFRKGYTQADMGRINAQKLFMNAFLKKLRSKVSITDVSLITKLAREVSANTVTDMGVDDMVYFAKNVLGYDMSSVSMLTLPSQTYGKYVVMNREATLDVINKYFNTFDKKITDGIFDVELLFCNSSDSSMSTKYYDSPDNLFDGNVYVGDGMEDNVIIPMDKEYLEDIRKETDK